MRRLILFRVTAVSLLMLSWGVATRAAGAATLPDHRAYELVIREEREGHEVDLNGVEPDYGWPSRDGNAIDWEALGGCCGATSAAQETYQSYRRANGWQTKALTPTPKQESVGGPVELFGGQAQQPVYWSPDLRQTIFLTPESFAPGNNRPPHRYDLYLENPAGELTWVTQGPTGTGDQGPSAEFDAATPDASSIVFSSAEALTANAAGIHTPGEGEQYLYLRDVAQGTTTLLNVDSNDELLSPRGAGATLGEGGNLTEGELPVDDFGTTTHAISEDGSKVFFETPPPNWSESHLYMRDLSTSTTVPLDDPSSNGGAHYQGASTDGSMAFFTSEEGLNGAPAQTELYEYNTTSAPIGQAAPSSATPISLGNPGLAPTTTLAAEAASGEQTLTVASTDGFAVGRTISIEGESVTVKALASPTSLELSQALGSSHPAGAAVTEQAGPILGVTAIANDGSRVYFVAKDVLAANHNSFGGSAQEGQPNLYLYDNHSGEFTYIATLDPLDISTCAPDCDSGSVAGLVGEPDISRPAYPTPDGSVLVFESTANLSGENKITTTQLTAPTQPGERTLQVESTAGLYPGDGLTLGAGGGQEIETIETIDSPTEVTVTEDGYSGPRDEFPAGAPVRQPGGEIYRYTAGGSLSCISCAGPGRAPIGFSTLGLTGGGTYAPPDENIPMNETASRIFFETATPLVEEAQTGSSVSPLAASSVYEWEDGHISLISDGSPSGSLLDGTTPSGDDAFISTHSLLTSGETGDAINVYDARVDGGFPSPPAPPAPCIAEACRHQTGAIPFFSLPASANFAGMQETGVAHATPTFKVLSITAAQRARLARTGSLGVTVTTTAPGTVNVAAEISAKKSSIRVAHASAKLTAAGTVSLKLHLSKMARTRLSRTHRLKLQLMVTYSASPTVKLATLTLRRAVVRSATQEHTHA